MPLGQAPFGSRQPGREPPDDDPSPSSGRFPSLSRSFFVVGFIALLAYLAAMASRGTVAEKQSGPPKAGPCLTNRSCAEGWRCFVVPKDDPFAVEGECSQPCEGSLQCPEQFECKQVAVSSSGPLVVPVGARGATAEVSGVCRPCGPKGCE
ncbi:MAG: hypothetical protein JNK82_24880 [Myxococcaceae bacterium]|nr:hypothetical protein [Myxococcaceae bacterium]